MKHELVAKLKRRAAGVDFGSFAVLVVSKTANGTYELAGGGPKDFSKSFSILFLALGFAAVLFIEKAEDEGSSCGESGQGKSRSHDCQSTGGGVQTKDDVVEGGICVMTKTDHFLVGGFEQLLMEKRTVAWK